MSAPESGRFWSIHTHSRYSMMDGMGRVDQLVERAQQLGHPALALTDHGTLAGCVELYRECRKRDILPLPGIEAYAGYGARTRKTFHVGMVAVSEQGWLNLIEINNQMNRDFYYKPVLDLSGLRRLDTTDVILTTGCFFGVAYSADRADRTAALNVIATLAEHFDVYVEAQVHGIVEDDHDDIDDQYRALEWANMLGLPMVLGQDSHYTHPEHRRLHDEMKRLGSWSDDPDSALFPGDLKHGYSMITTETARACFEPEVFHRGMAGLDAILARANVVIPPLDHFEPVILTSPTDKERIEAVYHSPLIPADKREAYWARIDDELDVINGFGFAGYMLLCKEITDHLRQEKVAYNIRGSACGSLVVYLLGISPLDPMRWGLGFDRFLSRNRAKLPDIDIDVDSTRRDEIVAWLRRTYVVTSIGTYAELRVFTDRLGQFKGSAVEKWKTCQGKLGKSKVLGADDYKLLEEMTAGGVIISSRGTHASGLVVAPDQESMRWMPLAVVGANKGADRFVTAFSADSTEALGYIKIDLLGVKVLNAVSSTVAQIRGGKPLPTDPDDPFFADADVYAVISEGLTDGMFQIEGWTSRKGLKRLKPRTIHDMVAAMALFRPAAMDSGATDRYIKRQQTERRTGRPTDYNLLYHPDIAAVIGPTYGELLYQEQVIDILKTLGFSPDELGVALSAIKASNSKVAAAAQRVAELIKAINGLATPRGWSANDIAWLKSAFEAYANYGFNKAHATAYGVLAYQTAWLNYYYPGQFWQAMIAVHAKDEEKVAEYTKQLASRRFVRMPVDVNNSGLSIRVDVEKRRIYPSLQSIKGIGPVTAAAIAAAQPFDSLMDFAVRMSVDGVDGVKALAEGTPPNECPGAVKLLADAGAFRTLD